MVSAHPPHPPIVPPRPIIPLDIKARLMEMDHTAVVCSLDRGELSTMLTTTSPCSCVVFFKTCLCRRHLFLGGGGVEGWSEGRMIHHGLQLIKLQLTLARTSPWFITCCQRLPATPYQSSENLQSEREKLWGNQRQKKKNSNGILISKRFAVATLPCGWCVMHVL